MATAHRGLKNLRTHAGVVGAAKRPASRHAIALKIAMLEIERARREKEREAADRRASGVADRLREIEEESQRLKAQLGESIATAKAQLGETLPTGETTSYTEEAMSSQPAIPRRKLRF